MSKTLIHLIKRYNWILNTISFIVSFFVLIKIKGRLNNRIIVKGAFLHNTKITIKGKNNSIKISPENRLKNCLIYIKGDNCLINIDNHCSLKNLELWIEDNNSEIIIGNRTTIESGHIASTEGQSIKIGNDCMFSHRIEIRNGDSHSIFDFTSKERINKAQSITIGNHVWLGADSKILKGVTISDGAIISTCAVVTKDVGSNQIFAGVPARKIKDNINWSRFRV